LLLRVWRLAQHSMCAKLCNGGFRHGQHEPPGLT
jgi:hypothetical protein